MMVDLAYVFFRDNWKTFVPFLFATVQILHEQVPKDPNPTFPSWS